MFENFERQVDSFAKNGFMLTGTILTVVTASMYGVQDYAFEKWDNTATEQTETVISELKQNISDMSDIKEKGTWLEKRKELAEHDAGAKWKTGSEPWVEYVVAKEGINEALKTQSKDFFEQVMTSQDIPEGTWGDLASAFNAENFSSGVSFSGPNKSAYVLRECQLEVSANGSMDLSEQAEAIASCKSNEEFADVFGTMVFGGIGGLLLTGLVMAGLEGAAPSIQRSARRRRERKAQPKKQN